MADSIVYGPAFSTYVRSVLLTLEEKGAPYRIEEINIFEDGQSTPEHLARHPFAKVPAFEHDGFALYETEAIMRYIDETFDGPGLQPADPPARARMCQAIRIVDAYAYPSMITAIVIQRLVQPKLGEEPDEAVVADAVPRAQTCVAALDGLIGGNAYLAGAALILADLHLAPVYDYLRQTPEGEQMLGGAANLARWWQAMSGRDSVTATQPSLG